LNKEILLYHLTGVCPTCNLFAQTPAGVPNAEDVPHERIYCDKCGEEIEETEVHSFIHLIGEI